VFVCLSACLSARVTGKSPSFFCACCLWPWLGPPLTALRYVMYFRFHGWLCFHAMRPIGRIIKHAVMFRRVRPVAILAGRQITAVFDWVCQNVSPCWSLISKRLICCECTEHAVREFWRQQGATLYDNFTLTATSADNDSFYQQGICRGGFRKKIFFWGRGALAPHHLGGNNG